MTRRTRRNHVRAFKAKAALAAFGSKQSRRDGRSYAATCARKVSLSAQTRGDPTAAGQGVLRRRLTQQHTPLKCGKLTP